MNRASFLKLLKPFFIVGKPQSTDFSQLTAQHQLQQQEQQKTDSFASYVNNRGQNNAAYRLGSSTLEQSGLYMPHAAQDITNTHAYAAEQQQNPILIPHPPPPSPAPLNSNWQQQAILNQQKQQQVAEHPTMQQQQHTPAEVLVSFRGQHEAILTQQQQSPQQQQQLRQYLNTNNLVPQQNPEHTPNLVSSLTQQQAPIKTQAVVLDGATNVDPKPEDSDEYVDSEEKSTEPPKKVY